MTGVTDGVAPIYWSVVELEPIIGATNEEAGTASRFGDGFNDERTANHVALPANPMIPIVTGTMKRLRRGVAMNVDIDGELTTWTPEAPPALIVRFGAESIF
jgi:hypothetical protein